MAKRCFDVCVAVVLLVLLIPVFAVVALAVALTMGRPVFLTQIRPGLGAQLFTLVKFRTMTNEVDAAGALLPDEHRLTPFGRFLRASSLDEIPELLNVLKGDMSLVGPRPLLPQYLDRYSQTQARRHEVRPGITGWAQVNGRNALSWAEKFRHDVWYVDHRSFALDLKILVLTIAQVLFREGISQDGHATAREFTGSD